MPEEREDQTVYKVVVNHEEQYSIWPANRENALGWKDAGKTGLKEECLTYIKEIWTDMRPLSLRQKCRLKAWDNVSFNGIGHLTLAMAQVHSHFVKKARVCLPQVQYRLFFIKIF
jgi:MbtH protein